MKKEKNVEEELSVSEADGNEIKWQEAEISHAKKESKGPVMVEAGPDRNERKEAEKENKVNTGEKIADKERVDKEKVTAEKKADKEKAETEAKAGKGENPAERDKVK